jgi:hypothetical protein
MLESGSSGSVRGVLSNEHPYREPRPVADVRPLSAGSASGGLISPPASPHSIDDTMAKNL